MHGRGRHDDLLFEIYIHDHEIDAYACLCGKWCGAVLECII